MLETVEMGANPVSTEKHVIGKWPRVKENFTEMT